MKIIISPAKKMRGDAEYPEPVTTPPCLEQALLLKERLQAMSYEELKELWRCNDQIAGLNYERLRHMDLDRGLSAALVSYDGIQYQYMAPRIFEEVYYGYVQEHLRILSGFYGILRPLDGVAPYRLEMQARLSTKQGGNLYEFWGDRLYRELTEGDHVILNLASHEYGRCIEKYLTLGDTFVTCVFGQLTEGRIREKGVYVKMARGEMVRYLAEKNADAPEAAKDFDRLGFTYREELSDERTYVFVMPDKPIRENR